MTHHHYNPQNTPQKNSTPSVRQAANSRASIQSTESHTNGVSNLQEQISNHTPPQNHPNTQSHQTNHVNRHKQPENTTQKKASPHKSQQKTRSVRRPLPPQNPVEKPNPKKKIFLGKGISGLLQGILPTSVYNPQSKKIFGVFSAEDLLLVALIFLCAESDDEDNSLLILALLYILVSDYIELPDLSF